MFAGFVLLGDTITLFIQLTDANGLPVAPDAAPTFSVYGASGLLASAGGTSVHVGAVTGLYTATIAATGGNGFDAGEQFSVRFAWAVSAAARAAVQSFCVT